MLEQSQVRRAQWARAGKFEPGRVSRFVVTGAFGPTENEVVPGVLRLPRQRTRGQAGVCWVRDGRKAYEKAIRRVYRDPQRTGKRGRPPLVLRQDVRLKQAVKQRASGRVAVRPVVGAPVACPYCVHEKRSGGMLRDRLNAPAQNPCVCEAADELGCAGEALFVRA